jgi:hypothetical protein
MFKTNSMLLIIKALLSAIGLFSCFCGGLPSWLATVEYSAPFSVHAELALNLEQHVHRMRLVCVAGARCCPAAAFFLDAVFLLAVKTKCDSCSFFLLSK